MSSKSPRRIQLEQSLAADPTDRFLRYGVALQCLREGDLEEGRERLKALIHDHPDEIAAYQQLGQSYVESGEHGPARAFLEAGVQQASRARNQHAVAEMSGLLELIN